MARLYLPKVQRGKSRKATVFAEFYAAHVAVSTETLLKGTRAVLRKWQKAVLCWLCVRLSASIIVPSAPEGPSTTVAAPGFGLDVYRNAVHCENDRFLARMFTDKSFFFFSLFSSRRRNAQCWLPKLRDTCKYDCHNFFRPSVTRPIVCVVESEAR